jgi:hypothetical protein
VSHSNPSQLRQTGTALHGHADQIESGPRASPLGSNSLSSLGGGTASTINSHINGVDGHVSTMASRVRAGGDSLHTNATNYETNESQVKNSFDKIHPQGTEPNVRGGAPGMPASGRQGNNNRYQPYATQYRPRPPGTYNNLNKPAGSASQPAIHWDSASGGQAINFLKNEYPNFQKVNRYNYTAGTPGHNINCNQCTLAVDNYLDNKRRPPSAPPTSGGGWAGPTQLQQKYDGQWNTSVKNYDDIINHIGAQPGRRGVVYIGRTDGTAHVFNVANTPHGVVFLDGQTGRLGRLEAPGNPGVNSIGLMQYDPANRKPAGSWATAQTPQTQPYTP